MDETQSSSDLVTSIPQKEMNTNSAISSETNTVPNVNNLFDVGSDSSRKWYNLLVLVIGMTRLPPIRILMIIYVYLIMSLFNYSLWFQLIYITLEIMLAVTTWILEVDDYVATNYKNILITMIGSYLVEFVIRILAHSLFYPWTQAVAGFISTLTCLFFAFKANEVWMYLKKTV